MRRGRPVERGEHQGEPGDRLVLGPQREHDSDDAEEGGAEEHRVAEPHRHADPHAGLERLPVDPPGLLRPVGRERPIRLTPARSRQNPSPPRSISPASTAASIRSNAAGNASGSAVARSGRSPVLTGLPGLTAVLPLEWALGCAAGPRTSARASARNGRSEHLEEHDPRAVRPRGPRVHAEHAGRPVPRRRSYRRRRHGRGLPLARRRARPARRDQGPAPEPRGRRRLRRALPARGQGPPPTSTTRTSSPSTTGARSTASTTW